MLICSNFIQVVIKFLNKNLKNCCCLCDWILCYFWKCWNVGNFENLALDSNSLFWDMVTPFLLLDWILVLLLLIFGQNRNLNFVFLKFVFSIVTFIFIFICYWRTEKRGNFSYKCIELSLQRILSKQNTVPIQIIILAHKIFDPFKIISQCMV